MLYKNRCRQFVAALILSSAAFAQQPTVAPRRGASLEQLRAHVAYLASPELEGRRTGSTGSHKAAEYISRVFKRYGFLTEAQAKSTGTSERGTSGSYLQTFPYVAAVELGKDNVMKLKTVGGASAPTTLTLKVGEDWMPLGFSASSRIENVPVVLAGFGITAADQNYDDYKTANARDRIALAFSGTPDGDNPHGRFTRSGEIRFKAAAARAAGAKALVLVAAEKNLKDDRLSRLSFDNAGGDAGLPVAVVSRDVAARVFGTVGDAKLAEAEKNLREQAARPGGSTESTVELPAQLKTSMNLSIDIVRKNAPATNVIGILPGSDPVLKNEVVVIGAHYDHLGRGGRGSLAGREGDVHHGADDNASGVAGVLELARLLSDAKTKMRRTVVLMAFSGEEEGLLGSSYYASHPIMPLEQTVAMINLDMIGRLRNGALMIGGIGTAKEWRETIDQLNNKLNLNVNLAGNSRSSEAGSEGGTTTVANIKAEIPVVTGANGSVIATADPSRRFNLRLNEDGFGPSDHSSFYAKNIPVLFFFTGTHEDYHKPSDTADRINYDGLASVVDFVRDLVGVIQDNAKRPSFAVAKVEAPSRSTGFRIYLGTVPSYAESTDGMKLDAVREGSPAATAGLKAGDKIVKLAGREIRNVYDYTQALSEMKAGQEYEVEIVREDQRVTLKITPAARRP
jgi:aminopeptidase YwaD